VCFATGRAAYYLAQAPKRSHRGRQAPHDQGAFSWADASHIVLAYRLPTLPKRQRCRLPPVEFLLELRRLRFPSSIANRQTSTICREELGTLFRRPYHSSRRRCLLAGVVALPSADWWSAVTHLHLGIVDRSIFRKRGNILLSPCFVRHSGLSGEGMFLARLAAASRLWRRCTRGRE
jgi:hypothetical protein